MQYKNFNKTVLPPPLPPQGMEIFLLMNPLNTLVINNLDATGGGKPFPYLIASAPSCKNLVINAAAMITAYH